MIITKAEADDLAVRLVAMKIKRLERQSFELARELVLLGGGQKIAEVPEPLRHAVGRSQQIVLEGRRGFMVSAAIGDAHIP